MKIERSKNAARNIVFGVILKTYKLAIPFVMRTLMIYTLGMQYLGLNSLFTSVLSVLNLAELGIGSAMVFSMYKPISEDDSGTICALMRLYKIYYRVIGLVILVIGCAITPLIPKLISGTVPKDMNVYVLYLMNLAATVLTYWLFAYKNSLLTAHQRSDINSKIQLATVTAQYAIQAIVLLATKNYYLYIIVMLATNAATNIITAVIVDRLYPQYKAKGKLSKEKVAIINRRVRDLFTSKVGAVIVDSVDTIVISAFLGLTVLAIYQNYFYILTSISGFVSIIFSSCTAGIGNSIITESEEKNYNDLKKFTLIISWLSGFCVCCLATLYQPFMELWTGKDNMLSYGYVIAFCVYFFVKEINALLNTYKDSAGIWHQDRFRPLATAGANLIMNLIMVQFWGLYGIILSTILSTLIVGMPWIFHNLFTTIFHKGLKKYLLKLAYYVIVVCLICTLCIICCRFEFSSLILTIAVRLVVTAVLSNTLFFAAFFKTAEFKQAVTLVNRVTKGKIRILKKFM